MTPEQGNSEAQQNAIQAPEAQEALDTRGLAEINAKQLAEIIGKVAGLRDKLTSADYVKGLPLPAQIALRDKVNDAFGKFFDDLAKEESIYGDVGIATQAYSAMLEMTDGALSVAFLGREKDALLAGINGLPDDITSEERNFLKGEIENEYQKLALAMVNGDPVSRRPFDKSKNPLYLEAMVLAKRIRETEGVDKNDPYLEIVAKALDTGNVDVGTISKMKYLIDEATGTKTESKEVIVKNDKQKADKKGLFTRIAGVFRGDGGKEIRQA
ncbi:hypothetical protein A2335_02080 [Candidatus Peregrinibacteria bacterium RIFOXYB2_FULL_32_7]|nr:MAG: hypothetical protein A2335_02080 [Candidatus Peregrinibacteria bacterium RIFOXYB2_FULL_32_7]